MTPKKNIKRRDFVSSTAAAITTISIVPRHVLGGGGYVPPSDKITVANIGCGTQGLREMPGLLQNPDLQVVAVCDPVKFSTEYLDWSANGIRNSIRKTLNDPDWGGNYTGIPGGLDVGQEYVEKYYAKNKTSGKYRGCGAYEDYRELLENEKDVDAIKIMTPDHLHAKIAIDAMNKGKHVVTHKPIANRIYEARKTIDTARKTRLITHLLAWSDQPDHTLIKQWIDDGVIGKLKEIHNWSYRPVWPQWTSLPSEEPPVPEGFNWDLWLGPVPDRPYHPHYTFNVFRGWYEFGGGSIADMGHYSLFPLFRTLGIETAPVSAKAYGTTTRTVKDNVCKWVDNNVAFPHSCMVRLSFPEQQTLPPVDVIWYDGGMKPFAPEELAAENRDIDTEGMMFVGEEGKIIADFLGRKPEIIPSVKMKAYQGQKSMKQPERQARSVQWARAIKNNEQSPGSFIHAEPVTEALNLGAVALRAGKKIEYDSASMKITNDEEANQYLTREYRKGWEI